MREFFIFETFQFITIEMLELQRIRAEKKEIVERMKVRNMDTQSILDLIEELDSEKRATQVELDNKQADLNKMSQSVGALFKEGKKEEANEMRSKASAMSDEIKGVKAKFAKLGDKITEQLFHLPNVPNTNVPNGKSDQENQLISEHGTRPQLSNALPHWELAKKFDLIDFELGVKLTGAGFPVYRGKGAILQRALINFFLSEAIKEGYEEVIPPILVNEASGYGTGQLPDKEGQMYHVGADDLYLIPTAEVPVTNILRNTIVKESQFPIKMTAYTPCFRREAGSYGKDVRGLNRLHQFDKVEIVQAVHPNNSEKTLQEMVSYVQSLLNKLGLEHRIVRLCGGDLGFAAAHTFDFEVYSAAQEKWLEVSSVSNFETFQSNRLKLRFKSDEGKTMLAHTLNGSALALPRIVASILENFQLDSGEGIKIPEVLVPFTGFDKID